MRRFHLGVATLALPVFALTVLVVGCSKDTAPKGGGQTVDTSPPKPKGEAKVLEPGKGILKGKITLKGSPDLAAMTKDLEEQIAKKADDKDYCLKGSETEKTEQRYRLSDKKLLGNVFVWVKPEPGTFFKVSKEQKEKAEKNPVVIRQPHCAFIPHCAVLFPAYPIDPKNTKKTEATGQYLILKNDAEISHNTNYSGGSKNPGENPTLLKKSEREVKNLVPAHEPVHFKCNIHGWMSGDLWVLDTPYYAISYSDTLDGPNKVDPKDPKFGTYVITGLPTGVKVRVIAWHEGDYVGKSSGETIDIKEGENVKDFVVEAK